MSDRERKVRKEIRIKGGKEWGIKGGKDGGIKEGKGEREGSVFRVILSVSGGGLVTLSIPFSLPSPSLFSVTLPFSSIPFTLLSSSFPVIHSHSHTHTV